jgi:hypothetical protein
VKRLAIVLVAVAAGGALLYAATVRQASAECEVCMQFEGARRCASAAAGTPEQAEELAVMAACAPLASGVTASLRCQAGQPVSRSCTER